MTKTKEPDDAGTWPGRRRPWQQRFRERWHRPLVTELEVVEYRRGAWTVLALGGELDVATAARLRDHVAQLVEAHAVRLIVDLDRLTFLDSSGLDVLVGAQRAIHDAGGELRTVASDERWLTLLHSTGLDKVLAPHRSVDRAVTGDSSPPE